VIGWKALSAALGLTLRPAVRAAIDGHVRLLLAWNAAINLTSVRDPAHVAVRHVADSLTGLGTLQAAGIDAFLDLGSGGGYPGIPLAAALPSAEALLIDSVGKKAKFLDVAVDAEAAARDVAKVLKSATANAENNFNLSADELRVLSATADEGPTLKRFRPRAQGRTFSILKRTSHITVSVADREES